MKHRFLVSALAVVWAVSCTPAKPGETSGSEPKPEQASGPLQGMPLKELDQIMNGKTRSSKGLIVATWPWKFKSDPPLGQLLELGLTISTAEVRNPGIIVASFRNVGSQDLTADQESRTREFIKKTGGLEPTAAIKQVLGPDKKTPIWMGTKRFSESKENWIPPVQHKIAFMTVAKAKEASLYFSDADYEKTMGWGGEDRRAYLGLTIKNAEVDPAVDAEGLTQFASALHGQYVGSFGKVKRAPGDK